MITISRRQALAHVIAEALAIGVAVPVLGAAALSDKPLSGSHRAMIGAIAGVSAIVDGALLIRMVRKVRRA